VLPRLQSRGGEDVAAFATSDIFLFEGFRLDRRGLSRRDERGVSVPVVIGSRAIDVLRVLIEGDGNLVSKDEIMAAVWPGTVVEDNNLTVQISALRRILDRGRSEGSCIQTVGGRGYCVVATVARHAADAGSRSAAVSGSSARPPPRLSIVVLPFTNLSNDPDEEYFADGITDDLTTDLSRISGSLVIARSTAFTYKGKAVDAKEVGRELGVRYLLEGSVRRSGNQVRVTTQLIDAQTNGHLWAERFDNDTGDLFSLQDEITSRIARALGSELVVAEAARLTEHTDALDCILRGRATSYKPPSRDNFDETISLYERALALDPRSVEAQSYLAIQLTARALDNMTDTPAADIVRAEVLAGQALTALPRSGLAHYAKGQVLRAQCRYGEAISEYETALAFNRSWLGAYAPLGWCKLHNGDMAETIALAKQAIRLSPRDPFIGNWYFQIGAVHFLQSRTKEAIVWFEKARSANTVRPIVHAYLASAYALEGETEHAVTELAEARRLSGDDRYSSIGRLKAAGFFRATKIRVLYEATYFAGLRRAGMPEE
jgi:adenylate cyclase